SNTLQIGNASLPYSLGTGGSIPLAGFFGTQGQRRAEAFQDLLDKDHHHVMEGAFAGIQKESIQINQLIASALQSAPPLTTVFPTSYLAQQLKMIARMVSIRQTLGVSR